MLFAPGPGGMLIAAVDRKAAARGLFVGQRLADARALFPRLHSAPADPAGELTALERLADWCTRYTPWAAVDGLEQGMAGLVLEITGCAHLCGGEAALLDDLLARLAGFGIAAQAAVADTPAAAWALARFDEACIDGRDADRAATRARLAALPVEALRLSGDLALQLRRLGLATVGEVKALPRAPLAARLGETALRRIDAVFGADHTPISPRQPVTDWQTRVAFSDGIARREDIDAAARHLLDDLCARLAAAGRGARALTLACYRLDGALQSIDIGTAKPTHQPVHLMRLFAEKLDGIDPGFGIEVMILRAVVTDPLALHQGDLAATAPRAEHDLAEVIDRLRNRLGPKRVRRLVPRDSHWPERAMIAASALQPARGKASWGQDGLRPLQLFSPPERLEVEETEGTAGRESGGAGEANPEGGEAAASCGTPARFRWRRSDYRVVRTEGPERIEPEWWRGGAREARDYFWVQDGAGRRFWIYRDRAESRNATRPAWYLHGLFA